MDIISILLAFLGFGLLLLLGAFLVIGILILVYLAATGSRWD
ncbi:MAG: hypothetical protein ACXAC8_13315 [Candidatus Hodarchaeales archaeon]